MAKATKTTTPRRGGKTAAGEAAATKAKAAGKKVAEIKFEQPPYEIALAAPGEDVPENGRRIGCPDCGAKHDIVPTEPKPGQGGTWTVRGFKCLAGCGYHVDQFPVG